MSVGGEFYAAEVNGVENSSSVRRGLSAAKAGVVAAIRSMDVTAIAIIEKRLRREADRYKGENVWKVMVAGKAD